MPSTEEEVFPLKRLFLSPQQKGYIWCRISSAAAPQLTVSVTGNKVQQENVPANVGCLIVIGFNKTISLELVDVASPLQSNFPAQNSVFAALQRDRQSDWRSFEKCSSF